MFTNNEVLNQPPVNSLTIQKQRIVAANSAILFVLAYLICYLAAQAATVFTAFSAQIPTVLYPGHLDFEIADAAWKKQDVISVYTSGPFVALALAFISAVCFYFFRKRRGLLKNFFLWIFLHGCNIFLGSLIAGSVTKSGFWFALRWSGFSETAVWILAFVLIVVLLGIGVLAAPAFLLSCDSISLMQYKNRSKMLAAMITWPFLAGSAFLLLLKFPDLQYYELLQFCTLILLLLPVYFLNQQNLYSETVEKPQKTKLAAVALTILVLVSLLFRVVLQNGMHFS